MPRRHAIAEGDALETGRASAKVAFRVLDAWSAQEGSGDLIVRLSAILMIHAILGAGAVHSACLLYTSPSPRDKRQSRMPSSA